MTEVATVRSTPPPTFRCKTKSLLYGYSLVFFYCTFMFYKNEDAKKKKRHPKNKINYMILRTTGNVCICVLQYVNYGKRCLYVVWSAMLKKQMKKKV